MGADRRTYKCGYRSGISVGTDHGLADVGTDQGRRWV